MPIASTPDSVSRALRIHSSGWIMVLWFLTGLAGIAEARQSSSIRLLGERPLVTTPDYVDRHWTIEDGLPVTAVRDVAQTPDGLVWLTTIEGLVRFDGQTFTVFNSTNTPELKQNRLRFLQSTDDGWLIIQSEDFHTVLRSPDGRFRSLDEDGIHGAILREPDRHGAGVLWGEQSNGDKGHFKYVGQGKLERIEDPPGFDQFMNLNGQVEENGRWTWFADHEQGVQKWNADGSFARLSYPGLPEDVGAYRFTRSKSGAIWVLHTDYSVSRLDGNRLVKVLDSPRMTTYDFGPGCFTRQPDGTFLVGRNGDERGLFRLDERGIHPLEGLDANRCEAVEDTNGHTWVSTNNHLYRDGRMVRSHTINNMIAGKSGDLWIACDEGLHRIAPSPITVIHDLPSDNTYGIFEDDDRRIWINNWNTSVGNVLVDDQLWDVSVNQQAMTQDPSGNMWMAWPGPGGRALQSFDPESLLQGETPATLYGRGMLEDNARVLFHDSNGRHWIGTENTIYERLGSQFNNVARHGARTIVEEPQGVIWFGGADGLGRYRDQEWSPFPDSLLNVAIRGMMVDPDAIGRLWIALEDHGLLRVDVTTSGDISEIVSLTTEHGLYQDGLHHVVQDDFGRMWFNTNFGLFWVEKSLLNDVADGVRGQVFSRIYNNTNGLLNREGNGGYHTSAMKSHDGRLWFANQKGVVVVNPPSVPDPRPFPPQIDQLTQRRDIVSLAFNDRTRLPRGRRDFEVAFTAANYSSPESMAFEYRLNGYESDWLPTTQRVATFTNIPPGDYAFEVRVATPDGSSEPVSLALAVPAFWYETWWFFGALILLLAGVAVSVPAYRLRAAERAREELDRLVAQRTRELRERTRALENEKQKTERQARELHELNEAKNRIFANLSHEFRTPLTLILGPLREFLGREDNPDRHTHELMERNAEELLSMVNRVLDLARLENHTLPFSPRASNLSALVRRVTEKMHPHAGRKNLTLTLDAEDRVLASFDTELMGRIVSNLISNAIKFTPKEGSIRVSVHREGDQAHIAVEDTGIGIAPEHIDHVFERFFQVDASSTRRHEGAGIGLSLVQELVRLHEGSISVTSAPEAGSRFLVRLPALSAFDQPGSEMMGESPEHSALATAPPVAGTTGDTDTDAGQEDDLTTILMVDDHVDIRRFMRSVLGDTFRVIEASDGEQAWELAQRMLPDLIISDIMMPNMDGFELNKRLKSVDETASIPVVFLTALAEERYRLQGVMSDADLYVTKPFEPGLLLEQVKSILRRRERLRSRLEARLPELAAAADQKNRDVTSFEHKVRSIIVEHLTDEDLDAQRLAALVGLSYSQLHRRLKREATRTPTEMIRVVRLETALPLLGAGDGTISEVAFAVGFNSLSYFNRCFQAEYGMSPSAYIKKELGTN